MLNVDRNWKYFEPVEIEPAQPEIRQGSLTRNAIVLDALRQEIRVLRRSLDHVLDENERLHFDHRNRRLGGIAEMRQRATDNLERDFRSIRKGSLASVSLEARSQQYTKDARTDLSRAQRGVVETSSGERQSIGAGNDGTRSDSPQLISTIDELSRVVVRWIFPASSQPRIRLVEAALRNRLRSTE